LIPIPIAIGTPGGLKRIDNGMREVKVPLGGFRGEEIRRRA